MEEKEYPVKRNIDGIYFRCMRNGRWENVCWTDMTEEERERVTKARPAEWWESMCMNMTETLRLICDQFNIVGANTEE